MKKLIIVVLSIMVFPLISQASFDTNFKYGNRDERIKEIQEFLTDQGVYSGPITGNYYSLTRKAVIAFQVKEGISPAYGFWGTLTRTKANEIKDLDDQNENSQELSETGTISNGDNDVCSNIEGIQTVVPSGMLVDTLKNCATPVVQQNTVQSQVIETNPLCSPYSSYNLETSINRTFSASYVNSLDSSSYNSFAPDPWVVVHTNASANSSTDAYVVTVIDPSGNTKTLMPSAAGVWKYSTNWIQTPGVQTYTFKVDQLCLSKTVTYTVTE